MKIMLCLDGSLASEAGIPICTRLADALGASVELVRAVLRPRVNAGEPHTGNLGVPPFAREIFARQDAEIMARLNTIAATFPSASVRLLHGNAPGQEIIQEALEQQTDIIIMTSHDTNAVGSVQLGSTVREVIQSGVAPVLIVHPNIAPPLTEFPIGAYVFTADGHELGELTEASRNQLKVRTSTGDSVWLRQADVDRLEIGHVVLHWDAGALAERLVATR